MLRVEGIHKSFDDFKAVNGANLTVDKGELVAVMAQRRGKDHAF